MQRSTFYTACTLQCHGYYSFQFFISVGSMGACQAPSLLQSSTILTLALPQLPSTVHAAYVYLSHDLTFSLQGFSPSSQLHSTVLTLTCAIAQIYYGKHVALVL